MKAHRHRFKFDCKMVDGHNHRINGIVDGMIGFGSFHLHHFSGVCSYRNHTHYFSGFTGLPIKTENGHIHKMEGILEFNDNHEHTFAGHTSEEVSYSSGKAYGEAYI